MKLRNLLLLIGLALAPLCMAGEIATFDKPASGISLSLWHDHADYTPNENPVIKHDVTETWELNVQISSDGIDWVYWGWHIGFILTAITLFLTIKWAYLAIMITEYQNFVWDMEQYYANSLMENYNFPYHECKAGKFVFNMRVWTVRDALKKTLDVFSHHDFDLWRENNAYRPKLKY